MTLRRAWDAEAQHWLAWARKPGHDSYWRFHRDAFLAGLPAPPAKVVDVGCGEGRLPRDLKQRGYEVIGVDGSNTLIAAAIAADSHGDYRVADAADLPVMDRSTDVVTMFMTPQDIDDIDGALREAARILRPGGHLRTATVHPINSSGRFVSHDPDAVFEIRGSYFDERPYADTVDRDGLTMTFSSVHRPVGRLGQAILGAGLLIDQIAEYPDLADPPGHRWRRLPLFLHLGAIKPLT